MNLSRLSVAQTHTALDATVAVTCACALLISGSLLRRSASRPAAESRGTWGPWAAFLGVCALLLVNQLLVQAYILHTHGGDPGFVTRYLGRGWFAGTPSWQVIKWLAASLPGDWLRGPLAYSLLRVQAVLELPFALLAYLSVVALLDAGLYRRLVGSALVPLAAVAFTFTFCLIELRLYNPWTLSDLRGRWLAAAAVILIWSRQRRWRPGAAVLAAPALGLVQLLVFFIGAAAVGAVVLVLYDVALLYNLAHLPARLPILGGAVLCGTLAAVGRSLQLGSAAGRRRPQPGLAGLSAILAAFAVMFFAPSLSIRYCGDRWSAVAGAAILFIAALLLGVVLAIRGQAALGVPRWRVLCGLLVALMTALGLLYGDAAGRGFGAEPPLLELFLLEQAALVLPLTAGAVWLTDRLLGRTR